MEHKQIPKLPGKTLSGLKLNDQQYDKLTVTRGTAAKKTLEGLMATDYWKRASDDERVNMLKDTWTYANGKGKRAIIPDANVDKWILNATNPVQAVIDRSEGRLSTTAKKDYKTGMLKSLEANNKEGYQTAVAGLIKEGVKEETIRGYITKAYKEKYQAAYKAGDEDMMDDIEDTLELTGFDYSETIAGWEKASDTDTE